jgi:hypothetical protein
VNRLPRVSGRNVTGSIAFAAVVVLSLAGCSGADKPTPKGASGGASSSAPGPASSSAPGPASGELKDESAAILAWTPPAPVAKTEGKVSRSPYDVGNIPATAEIISVQAGDSSTILTWQLSSATDINLGLSLQERGHGAFTGPSGVRLVDTVGQKSYAVNSVKVGMPTYFVYSRAPRDVGPVPVRMTAEYPALPATTTSVSVRIPYFAPVTVPVTRY